MIDLHVHSTASDGTMSPTEIVQASQKAGLSAVALTDHDTVAGLPEAINAASNLPITFIPGVEISAKIDRGCLHIVGLYVDPASKSLRHELKRLIEMRNERNLLIAERLCSIGMPLKIEEVADAAGGDVVGRPHFAQIMIEKGYIKNHSTAFSKYLNRGGKAHVSKERLDRRRAIEIIRDAGGVPILAHPTQTYLDGDDLDRFVGELTDMGLAGIESYYSGYHPSLTKRLNGIADKYGLAQSGGSDFHGSTKKGIALGKGPGKLHVPDELVEKLAMMAKTIKRQSSKI